MIRVNVIGQAGAGKSTLVTQAQRRWGGEIFRPSDVIRKYANLNHLPLTNRVNYLESHTRMTQDDPDAIVRPVITSEVDRLWLDGLRAPEHVRILQDTVGLVTIAIECPDELRFERALIDIEKGRRKRGLIPQALTLKSFLDDEVADNDMSHGVSVEQVMGMAKYVIDGSQSPEGVSGKLDGIISSMIGLCA